ncbi:MAG TPA: EAL domain-containing protein [Acidimicrobiales bacterium]|nr:EAL domain-containing protein [Acidimicrobiales bacterium]
MAGYECHIDTNEGQAAPPLTEAAENERLRASERRLRKIVQRSSQVLAIYDAQGVCQFVYDSLNTLAGWGQDIVGHKPTEPGINLIPDDQLSEVMEWFAGVVAQPGEHPPAVFRARHRDGSEFWAEVVATNLLDDPDVAGIVLDARDVTERRALEESLLHQSLHDDVTGLPNRALFMDRVGRALSRDLGRASRGLVVVMILELDRFKLVVDSFGHRMSDELLVQAAGVLVHNVGVDDTVARLGGGEFAICCENLRDEGEALATAARLGDLLPQAMVANGRELQLTASIGIATARNEYGVSPESLLRDADVALSRAKERGGNRHEVFDETARLKALERLELENGLRAAIPLQELRFHYQPTINLADHRVVGAEALVRWQHATRGLLMPAQFIPVAEDTGLVVPLGKAVIEAACRQVDLWRRTPGTADWTVAVNVSGRQLSDAALVAVVQDALANWGVPAAALWLEITESALMADPDEATATLVALHELGVKLAIDDFGTGYSSLTYLRRFPIDALKIDRSFVNGVSENVKDAKIVAAVVALAHAFGIPAVAEGVETASQAAQLVDLGCDLAQGYLWGKPQPAYRLAAPAAEPPAETT